jgi:hypothetical protein
VYTFLLTNWPEVDLVNNQHEVQNTGQEGSGACRRQLAPSREDRKDEKKEDGSDYR